MSADGRDPTVRVGIALSHGLIRQGAEGFLAGHSACILLDALECRDTVDVVITDKLSDRWPLRTFAAPMVLCANLQTRTDVVQAFSEGAQACVSVYSAYQHLMLAIESAREWKQYLCPFLAAVMGKPACTTSDKLTSRESDVMHWISIGYSTKQIGRILGISPYTVDTHRRNIMQKLGTHKVAELTRYAITRERPAQTPR